MSQYLSFYLIKKNSTEKVSLGYFCTTPARQIAYIGAFPYTEEDVILDRSLFSSYLESIEKERDETQVGLSDNLKRKQEIEQNIFKCQSREVAQMFIEQIDDVNCSIKDYEETLDDWNWRISRLEFILDIWSDNEDEWNLYYNNC